jgi:hypothetical protein
MKDLYVDIETKHDLERSEGKLMKTSKVDRDLNHIELSKSKCLEEEDLNGDTGKLSTNDLKAIIDQAGIGILVTNKLPFA